MCCLVLDVETTIGNKGDPFDERNSLSYVGCLVGHTSGLFDIEYTDSPYRGELVDVAELISNASPEYS